MLLAPTLLLNAGSGAAIARPTFSRDFAGEKTLNNGTGPAITFTRASNATFFDANGTLQTASNDTPRFDHDPATGASRGLLIEEARTNLLTSSKTFSGFDGGGWTSVTDDYSVSPDGTTTASLFDWSTVANSYKCGSTTITSVAGATYTATAFIKPVSGTGVVGVRVGRTDSSQFAESQLNLGTNANTSSTTGADVSGVSVSAQNVGNGWYRLSATGTFANSYNNFTAFVAAVSGSGSFLAWGAQLEAGAFATSYIPTTTAAATRSADSAVVTPISSFYNQAEGTMVSETTVIGYGSGFPTVWFLNNSNGATQYIAFYHRPNNYLEVSGSGYGQATGGVTIGTTYRLGFATAAGSTRLALNGSLIGSDSTAASPTITAERLDIGSRSDGSQRFTGHIRKIAYWPKRLSNTLLQQLTT